MVTRSLQALPFLVYIPTVPLYSKCRLSLLPGMLEIQHLRLHSKSPESESVFFPKFPEYSCGHEILRSSPAVSSRTQAIANQYIWHSSDHRNWLRNGNVFKKMLVEGVLSSTERARGRNSPFLPLPAMLFRYDASLTMKAEAKASQERRAEAWLSHTWSPQYSKTRSVTGANISLTS